MKVRQVLETQVRSLQTVHRISSSVHNSRDVKGEPSHKVLNAEDFGPVVRGGFLEEVGLDVSWDWDVGVA